MDESIKQYPQRPSPVGLCKCNHKYTQHTLTDTEEEKWKKGGLSRLLVNLNILSIGFDIFRKECRECMCPMYDQVKIIDEKTGNEIKESVQ